MATALGPPVCTTRTIAGAIVGLGSVRRASAARRGVAGTIVRTWVFTVPESAFMPGIFYRVSLSLFP